MHLQQRPFHIAYGFDHRCHLCPYCVRHLTCRRARADVVALSKTVPVVGVVGPSCAVQRRFPCVSEETPASDFAAWMLFPLVVSLTRLH